MFSAGFDHCWHQWTFVCIAYWWVREHSVHAAVPGKLPRVRMSDWFCISVVCLSVCHTLVSEICLGIRRYRNVSCNDIINVRWDLGLPLIVILMCRWACSQFSRSQPWHSSGEGFGKWFYCHCSTSWTVAYFAGVLRDLVSGAPVCLIFSSVCQSETRAHSVASRCRVPSLSEESEHGDEDKPSLSKSTQLLMKQVCVSGVSGWHNLRDSVCRSCTSLLIVSDSVLLWTKLSEIPCCYCGAL